MRRALILSVFLSGWLIAQVGTDNAIVGLVTDPTQAVLAGATVTVTNLDTGLRRSVQSGESGNFELLSLPRGRYSIEVTVPRFKPWVLELVELGVGQRFRVVPVLELGDVVERVRVEAVVELLQTEKGSVESGVEEKSIRELPVNSRNPVSLVGLVPGMSVVSLGAGRHR